MTRTTPPRHNTRHDKKARRCERETGYTQTHDQNNTTNDHTKDHPPHLTTIDMKVPTSCILQRMCMGLAFTRYSFTYRLLCTNPSSFYCPSHLHRPHGCNTIAILVRNTQPPSDPPFSCHTPYNSVIAISCKG